VQLYLFVLLAFDLKNCFFLLLLFPFELLVEESLDGYLSFG
jgi:hypothetical protein